MDSSMKLPVGRVNPQCASTHFADSHSDLSHQRDKQRQRLFDLQCDLQSLCQRMEASPAGGGQASRELNRSHPRAAVATAAAPPPPPPPPPAPPP